MRVTLQHLLNTYVRGYLLLRKIRLKESRWKTFDDNFRLHWTMDQTFVFYWEGLRMDRILFPTMQDQQLYIRKSRLYLLSASFCTRG